MRWGAIFLVGITQAYAATAPRPVINFAARAKALIEEKDMLGLRIDLQRAKGNPALTSPQWKAIRDLLHQHHQVGFDLIYIWDRAIPRTDPSLLQTFAREKRLIEADRLMQAKKFNDAHSIYEQIAREIRPTLDGKNGRANRLFYYSLIRSMARASYSVGKYREALEYYQWIPPVYPRYRQVLLEKAWAAFLLGRVDLALGAVASQGSAFFSPYLEPESYLIEIYLLKRLCRTEDLKLVLKQVGEFTQALKGGTYDYKEWAKSDIETRALLQLLEKDINEGAEFVLPRDRQAEKNRIESKLKTKFESEKKKLLAELGKVSAYAHVAVFANISELQPITKYNSRDAWMKLGLEIWPTNSDERWVDELGTERFLGESQCSQKPSS